MQDYLENTERGKKNTLLLIHNLKHHCPVTGLRYSISVFYLISLGVFKSHLFWKLPKGFTQKFGRAQPISLLSVKHTAFQIHITKPTVEADTQNAKIIRHIKIYMKNTIRELRHKSKADSTFTT